MDMTKRVFLGMLTPSSNTALEPLTGAILACLPEVSAHFGRFKVTEISLEAAALSQFNDERVLEAARLLADAKVDVIAWSGTSAGWLGLDADERLCERITKETGIPATSSTLALKEVMERSGRRVYGLVTPYLGVIQEKIAANFARHGLELLAERHLNICINFDFSEVSEAQLETMIQEVARAKPQCITTYCTNLRAIHLVDRLERETGIPIYDSIATAVWKSLKIAGIDTRRIKGWGSLFQEAF